MGSPGSFSIAMGECHEAFRAETRLHGVSGSAPVAQHAVQEHVAAEHCRNLSPKLHYCNVLERFL
jgi:hypothetical protein